MEFSLICLAVAVVAGLLMSRPAKKLHLPAVTAYLVAGLLIGPFCLGALKIPGVGRKTANVVLGDAFEVPGLPVDTHVIRLTNLIGLVKTEDAVEIERILCSALPPEYWSQFSHQLIIHGRTRCPARRPDCTNCEIRDLCKNFNRKIKK